MGVYCFKWRRGPWLKVGHYHRANPWSRIARRGWRSVECPDVALTFAPPEDFELLYWSPSLTRRHESAAHRAFPDRYGEWIGERDQAGALAVLEGMDPLNAAAGCSREAALASRRLL